MITNFISSYPFGLRVFLRTQNDKSDLHFIDLPLARGFGDAVPPLLHIVDADSKPVGIFLIEAISGILPLIDPILEPASSAKN